MTRWRVDFRVKSELVLEKHEKKIKYTSPDNKYEIHLYTKRGEGKHAADELYLSAHVILQDNDPKHAADEAEICLQKFLDVLAIVTNTYYKIKSRTMVVDWTPGIKERHFLYFKAFPDPGVPRYALNQELLETVKKFMTNPIPLDVQLAMGWWAQGVSAASPNNQFQFFWYALEILAEHSKPSTKVPTKCPVCNGDLFCKSCNVAPLHRPYPKQTIKMLVDKHVRGEPEKFFELIDEARNRLLHGDDPEEIERALGIKWEKLSDSLGKATWASLISVLINISATTATTPERVALIQTNTFTHYHVVITTDMSMGANHADPANPQIEEFQPDFQLNMTTHENQGETKAGPTTSAP